MSLMIISLVPGPTVNRAAAIFRPSRETQGGVLGASRGTVASAMNCRSSGIGFADQLLSDLLVELDRLHLLRGRGMARTYLPRVADGELATRMSSAGAVLIEGPKACGKTATSMQARERWSRLLRRFSSASRSRFCSTSGRSCQRCGIWCAAQ